MIGLLSLWGTVLTGKDDGSLRERLRRETAGAHERVDALFGACDFGTEQGYAAFLRAQAVAWETLRPLLDQGSTARADALLRDLDELGLEAPPPLADVRLPGEATIGHGYVLEGSRLGSAVLLRQLRAKAPALADRASAYLHESGDTAGWRLVSTRLQKSDGACANDEDIIGDALFVFDLFERSWQAVDGVPANIS
ncbi:biliverdin-producing heme oxygenase [Sphingomonas sp. Root1294]|nr:biliverdin-producing heme oxygenase [Sphingomonas sp. Root1294]